MRAAIVLCALAACTPDLTRPPGLYVACSLDAQCGPSEGCRFGACTTEHVGGQGEPCLPDGRCDEGLVCAGGSCIGSTGGFRLVPSWSFALGDASTQDLDAMATDRAGNTYIAGTFRGKISKDGTTVQSTRERTVFVAHVDAFGSLLWAKAFDGTAHNQRASAIAVAADGSSVAITGLYYGDIVFDGTLLKGDEDDPNVCRTFVVRWGADGRLQWARTVSGSGPAWGLGIATDASSRTWVTGFFTHDLSAGGRTLAGHDDEDAFLLRYDASGNADFAKAFGSGGKGDFGTGIAADPAGNVFLTGYFGSSVDFGTGALTTVKFDLMVAKFSPAGQALWARRAQRDDGDGDIGPWHVAAAADGSVVVASDFSGAFELGGDVPALQAADLDALVFAYDSAGKPLWARALGGTGTQTALAVAAGDVVYAGGAFRMGISGFGSPVEAQGGADAFVASIGADGAPLALRGFGDSANQYVAGVGIDATGNLYVGGVMEGTLNTGAGTIASAGDTDVFLARFRVER